MIQQNPADDVSMDVQAAALRSSFKDRGVRITVTGNATLRDVRGVCARVIAHTCSIAIHLDNGYAINFVPDPFTSGEAVVRGRMLPGIPGRLCMTRAR